MSDEPSFAAQIKRARSLETLGIACEGCGQSMEFEFPVTFWRVPLCEECEESPDSPEDAA